MDIQTKVQCSCGGALAPQNIRGEAWPYKDESSVPVDGDHVMQVCTRCGESWLDDEQTEQLEAALAASYAEFRIRKQQKLIQSLVERFDLTQGSIERLLGVSAGYLSKAQHQSKVLSPTTFRLLYLLARDPYGIAREISTLDESLAPFVEHLDQELHPLLV